MTLSAGTVSIGVKPDTSGFGSELKSGILGHTKGVGEGMGGVIMDGLKTMAGPIAAVTAAFSVGHLLEDSMKSFEDLASTVKGVQRVTGGTAEDVSRMTGAMQLAGVNVDAASGAMTIFSKNLGKASTDASKTAEMNKLFGQSIKDASGNVKSMADLLPGLADKFATMPDGAQKTALATQLFGRAGAQMIPVLNKGAAGIQELSDKAEKMGLVLNDKAMASFAESRKSARDFNAAIQGVKVSLGQDLVPVVDAFQNVLRNAVTPALQATGKFLRDHQDSFIKLGEVVDEAGKKFGEYLAPILKSVGDAFRQLGPTFMSLAPQLVQLSGALSPVHLIFESLKPILPTLIDLLVTLATTLAGALGQALAAILPPVTELAKLLIGDMASIFKALVPLIVDLANHIGSLFASSLVSLTPLVVTIIKFLLQLAKEVITPLIPVVMQLVSALLEVIKPLVPLIGALLPPLIELFKALMPVIMPLATFLADVLVVAIKLVSAVLLVVIGVVKDVIVWFENLVTGVVNAGKNIAKWFQDLPKTIKNLMDGAGDWLVEAGKNLIQGLINGATSMGSAVNDWVHNLGNTIANGFKSFFGIHSPSTVFHGYGVNIVEGLANGLTESQDLVSSAMDNLNKMIAQKAPTQMIADMRAQVDTLQKAAEAAANAAFKSANPTVTTNGITVDPITGLYSTGTPTSYADQLANASSVADKIAIATNNWNAGYQQLLAQGISSSQAFSMMGDLTPALDSITGANSSNTIRMVNPNTGMTMTSTGDITTDFAQNLQNAYANAGYQNQPIGGTTIVYNAAPNDSISSGQALTDAIQRAKVLGAL